MSGPGKKQQHIKGKHNKHNTPMDFPTFRPFPLLLLFTLATASESSSGDVAEPLDLYTIASIVFLSLLGFLLFVRLITYVVSCDVYVEARPPSRSVVGDVEMTEAARRCQA